MQSYYRSLALLMLASVSHGAWAESNLPTVDIGLRTRWETATVDKDDAHALTAKARLTVNYRFLEQFDTMLEIDHVATANDDQHSDGVVLTDKPTIADPEGTEINQAFIRTEWQDNTITLGRQKITYSDERFIGNVGFRQNDQTYDAIQSERYILEGSQLHIAYIHNVNRIFGDDADRDLDKDDLRYDALNGSRPAALLGNHHIDGWLVHLTLKEWDYLEFNTYGYSIHNYHVSNFSNQTVGFEGHFQRKFGQVKIESGAELAYQQQPDHNNDRVHYQRISGSLTTQGFTLGLRHELLTENNGTAFITPLATLHRFQGWADQFLVTPSVGLRDNSVNIKWRARPWTVDIRHHWFTSDAGSVDIGQEWNVDLIFKPKRKHEVKLRYADFNHASEQTIKSVDVEKVFLMYSYNI